MSKYAADNEDKQQESATTTETSSSTETLGAHARGKSRVSAAGNEHDPHPTVVPKRSAAAKNNNIQKKKSKQKGLTWGEEAQKLSNMVRSKYMHVTTSDTEDEALPEVTENQLKLFFLSIHNSLKKTRRGVWKNLVFFLSIWDTMVPHSWSFYFLKKIGYGFIKWGSDPISYKMGSPTPPIS